MAPIPEKRHQEDCQENESHAEAEDQQQCENQGLLEPLAFFLELGDKQFDTGVKSRR